MKVYNLFKYGFFITIGMTLSNIIFQFRFMNPIMLEEFELVMKNMGNVYFLMFIIIDLFFVLLFGMFWLIFNRKTKSQKGGKWI